MKLFNRNFQKGDLTEQTNLPGNPDRGWYRLYTFSLDQGVDLQVLKESISADDSLALIMFDIGCYRDRDLDDAAMQYMRGVLSFFVAMDKEIILRIAYDHEGKALEREPSLFAQVKNHMLKVRELIAEFDSRIFVFQGVLTGNWGEMHSSRFLEKDKLREMTAILTSGIREDTFFSVRKPSQIRSIYTEAALFSQGNFQDIHGTVRPFGLFDDAILGSETDYGTYAGNTAGDMDWESAWSRDKELGFIEKIGREAPVGGEAIYGEGYIDSISQERLLAELRRLHVTYLNSMYDRNVLDNWARHNYNGRGPWMGINLYDYIGAHLGYRFLIRDVKISFLGKSEGERACEVTVDIENVGFANLYREAEVYLSWLTGSGEKGSKKISCDLRLLDAGKRESYTAVVGLFGNAGTNYAFYLTIRRKQDGRVIYPANKMMGESVYLGYIK